MFGKVSIMPGVKADQEFRRFCECVYSNSADLAIEAQHRIIGVTKLFPRIRKGVFGVSHSLSVHRILLSSYRSKRGET